MIDLALCIPNGKRASERRQGRLHILSKHPFPRSKCSLLDSVSIFNKKESFSFHYFSLGFFLAKYVMPSTKEGYLWTLDTGAKTGLDTEAVVSGTPSSSIRDKYDVVVVGTGFSGLVAARDLTRNPNLKVLLLDGRRGTVCGGCNHRESAEHHAYPLCGGAGYPCAHYVRLSIYTYPNFPAPAYLHQDLGHERWVYELCFISTGGYGGLAGSR